MKFLVEAVGFFLWGAILGAVTAWVIRPLPRSRKY